MSALLLYRLLQKAYSSVMATIMGEEAAKRRRQKTVAAQATTLKVSCVRMLSGEHDLTSSHDGCVKILSNTKLLEKKSSVAAIAVGAATTFRERGCFTEITSKSGLERVNVAHRYVKLLSLLRTSDPKTGRAITIGNARGSNDLFDSLRNIYLK
ncbi:hypothetical protein IFM89_008119 [Coptis chinensis]|uniref:Uncharacterized protein n=1 Tax=Coptis chinensis TaxID=261450 RepID=A0A835IU71_9MAGN|nr:hypothetical protein IFM89_008119 [Coptis chinensis]